MNYAPLTWYKQEYLRCKAHYEALPRAPCSLRLFALKVLITKILPVGHTGRYTSSYNSQLSAYSS